MLIATFAIALISTLVIAISCPDLPIGRTLRKRIASVGEACRNASPTRFVIWGLVIAGIILIARIAVDVKDGTAFLRAIPEAVSWLFVYDGATYVEILAAVWLARAALGVRLSLRSVASALVSIRDAIVRVIRGPHTGRSPRSVRPTQRKAIPQKEDDPDGLAVFFGLIRPQAAGA